MPEMMTEEIPVVNQSGPVPAIPEGLSFKKEDLQSDLAKLGGVPQPVAPVVIPAEMPAVTPTLEPAKAPEAAPVTVVPEKFRDVQGNPDLAKIEKSTVSAIKEYLAIEAELRKAQNAKRDLAMPAIPEAQPAPQLQPTTPGVLDVSMITPQMIMDEMQLQGWDANNPQAMAKAQAVTSLKLATIAQNAAYQRAKLDLQGEVAQVRDRVDAKQGAEDLQTIVQSDPGRFTPEGMQSLIAIRKDNPAIRDWNTAYEILLGRERRAQFGQQVQPIPTAKTTQPPVAPVEAAGRIVSQAPAIDYSDRRSIDAALNKLPQDKQLEFLRQELARKGIMVK